MSVEETPSTHASITHRLSDEILGRIFLYAIGCARNDCRLVDLHAHIVLQYGGRLPTHFEIAATCRKWRALVISTPRLWTRLYINGRPPSTPVETQTLANFPNLDSISSFVGAVGKALKFSGTHDIEELDISPVEWLHAQAPGIPAVDHFREVIGLLVVHSHRWKSLKLITSGAQIKYTHWTCFLPIAHRIRKLERIDIDGSIQPLPSAQDRWVSKNLFMDAPALRSVRMVRVESHQVDIPWSQIANLNLKAQFTDLGVWRNTVESLVAENLTWEAYTTHPEAHAVRRQPRRKSLPPPRNEHVRHLTIKTYFTPIVLPALESLTIAQCDPQVFAMALPLLIMSNAMIKRFTYDIEQPWNTWQIFRKFIHSPCCDKLEHWRHVFRDFNTAEGAATNTMWIAELKVPVSRELKTIHFLVRPPFGGGKAPELHWEFCRRFWDVVKLNRQQDPWMRKSLAIFSRISEEDDYDKHIEDFINEIWFRHIKQTAQISDVRFSVRIGNRESESRIINLVGHTELWEDDEYDYY